MRSRPSWPVSRSATLRRLGDLDAEIGEVARPTLFRRNVRLGDIDRQSSAAHDSMISRAIEIDPGNNSRDGESLLQSP